MLRKLALPLLLAPLVLTGCYDECEDCDPDTIIVDGVPPGGADLGLLLHFDHNFADRDISDAGDTDGFEFSLSQESVVVITLTGQGGFDGFMDLYTRDFSFIMGDDNGGPGADPVLVGALSAGEYFVVVGGSGGSTGTYLFDITAEPMGGADLGVLAVPDSVLDGADISDAADVDSYIFTVNSAAILDVFLTRTSGTYDGNLQILDEYGIELAFIDPAGDADPSALSIAINPGTFIIRVGASSGSGNYTVQVDLG
jgi:hypothetical protein